MKKIFIILLVFLPALVFCQHTPIELSVQPFQTGNHTFTFHIDIEIKDGWHAFALPDTALGIEPFSLLLENRNILIPDNAEDGSDCKTVLLKDSLFNGKFFSVFTKNILIEKTVEFKDNVPFIIITLKGFASDNKKNLPIYISKEVKIKI